MKCLLCDKEYEQKRRKVPFCYDCLPSGYKGGTEKRKLWKKYVIKVKGGKCCKCGYDKCQEALDLHHRDGNIKTETPTELLRNAQNWEDIEKEIEACDLLCANCHREIHASE